MGKNSKQTLIWRGGSAFYLPNKLQKGEPLNNVYYWFLIEIF